MMFCAGLASSYCHAATGAMLRRWLAEGQRLLHFNRLMAPITGIMARAEGGRQGEPVRRDARQSP
ncbi:MAG: hypothetical protein Q4E06_05785 [Lautropia sp.]|nr:hypothetical protein [Lautropia sp.]